MGRKASENTCEEETFAELFRIHSKDLYHFLFYKYGRENNPQDVVQEAFIKLWDNCHRVLPVKARAFLFKVAQNQMLNDLARVKTAVKYSQEKQRDYTIESPQFTMEEKEYGARLQQAIRELTEDQRLVFMLNRVEGKRHKEIAAMLGISQKTVEKRIYTALSIIMEKVGKI